VALLLRGRSSSVDDLPPFPVASFDDDTMRPRGPIAVVGDSLTAADPGHLLSTLASAGWGPIRLDAQPGRRTVADEPYARSGLATVQRLLDDGFDGTWLIALGTNDLGVLGDRERGPSPEPVAVIDEVLAALGPSPTVWWVDVHVGTHPSAAARFNAALAAAATSGRITIVGWGEAASTHPSWMDPDGIHTTTNGARERNRFVVAAIS
jgi:hypothetical protein